MAIEYLQAVLQLISSVLLYPVMIILFILTIWALVLIGGITSEYSNRNRDIKKAISGIKKAKECMDSGKYDESVSALTNCCATPIVSNYAKNVSRLIAEKNSVQVEKILQDYELKVLKKLESTRIISHIAPMLGLIGTLVPLGPGLVGLIEGDITILANALVIAFSTTVIGLAVGGTAYAVTTIRRRWYAQDMSDIEYISAILFDEIEAE